MATKNYRIWSHSLLSCGLLFLVLVLVNIALARTSMRVDLTEEGLYTLRDGSRNILSRVRDPLSITVYWGNNAPQSDTAKRYVEGLLEEMVDAAGDRLAVRWVDTDDEDGRKEAEKKEIKKFLFMRTEGSKQVQSVGYQSLMLESGADEPFKLDNVAAVGPQVEYALMAEIERRTRVAQPTVAMVNPDSPLFLHNDVTGDGKPGRFNQLKAILRGGFGTKFLELPSLESAVPSDVSVLLVVAPWKLSEASAYYLEQYVLRGGRLILLMDPVNAENTIIPGQEREPRSSGLEDWLAHLGITLEYGLVGDFKRGNQGLNMFNRKERGAYAFWPRVTPENMDKSNIVFGSIGAIPMCFPSAITVDDDVQQRAKRTAKVLARTSEMGYRRAEIGAVADTLEFPMPLSKDLESIPLVVMLEGPLTSKWKGKERPKTAAEIAAEAAKKAEEEAAEGDDEAPGGEPVPDDAPVPAPVDEPGGDDKPADPEAPDQPGGDGGEGDDGEEGPAEPEGPPRLDAGEVKIIIAADAEMCADYMGVQTGRGGQSFPPPNGQGGFVAVVGLAEWLSGGEDLISLRSRNSNPRTLEPVEESEKKVIQWLNMAGIPLLLLFAGIVVFAVRRSQRS